VSLRIAVTAEKPQHEEPCKIQEVEASAPQAASPAQSDRAGISGLVDTFPCGAPAVLLTGDIHSRDAIGWSGRPAEPRAATSISPNAVSAQITNVRVVGFERAISDSGRESKISGIEAWRYAPTRQLGHSDNATPPSVETVAGGAESLFRQGLVKSRVLIGRPAAPKVHPKVIRLRTIGTQAGTFISVYVGYGLGKEASHKIKKHKRFQ